MTKLSLHLLAFVLTTILIVQSLCFSLESTGTRNSYALITGGNKGIGKEIARRLGFDPDITAIIASRDVEAGELAAADLRSEVNDEGGTCDAVAIPMPLDLTNADSIAAAAEHIEQEYGVLDILVNNAAICFNSATLYGKVEYTSFRDQADITIQTNYFGTLGVTQAFLPLLKKSPSPRIINVASAAGRLTILQSQELVDTFTSDQLTIPQLSELMKKFVSDVNDGTHTESGWPNTCYGVSKLGVIAQTRILARENPDILINSVDPGYCRTDQNDNQGTTDPARGAYTPYLLAVMEEESDDDAVSGLHFFEEREIPWSYQ